MTLNVLNVKKDYPYKTYISNNYKPQIAYVENNLYKRSDNITFNNTNNIYKHMDQYSTDVFNTYKINKLHNVKKTYYNVTNDVVINEHNNINTNDTYNVTKIKKKFVNFNDSMYFTKKIEHNKISLIILQDIAITIMNIM